MAAYFNSYLQTHLWYCFGEYSFTAVFTYRQKRFIRRIYRTVFVGIVIVSFCRHQTGVATNYAAGNIFSVYNFSWSSCHNPHRLIVYLWKFYFPWILQFGEVQLRNIQDYLYRTRDVSPYALYNLLSKMCQSS